MFRGFILHCRNVEKHIVSPRTLPRRSCRLEKVTSPGFGWYDLFSICCNISGMLSSVDYSAVRACIYACGPEQRNHSYYGHPRITATESRAIAPWRAVCHDWATPRRDEPRRHSDAAESSQTSSCQLPSRFQHSFRFTSRIYRKRTKDRHNPLRPAAGAVEHGRSVHRILQEPPR